MFADIFPLTLLATGVYPLSKDEQVRFDESALGRIAGVFNDMKPARPAPVVIGHPIDDMPSYGTVNFLRVIDGSLIGYTENLSENFRRGMDQGLYPRYAAQFFGPDNPDNPVPGTWFLKHVGFMGPVPPAVRGFLTTDAEFMETLQGPGRKISPEMRLGGTRYVEFAEFGTAPVRPEDIARLARAHQFECAARGSEISASQAVMAVTEMHGAKRA
jgi:hypothetical protein